MSRKLTIGKETAFYSYNRKFHRIDARVMHKGQFYTVSGRNLGEVKSTLLVLAGAARTDVYTLVPARTA
jgi:hypothetical protein